MKNKHFLVSCIIDILGIILISAVVVGIIFLINNTKSDLSEEIKTGDSEIIERVDNIYSKLLDVENQVESLGYSITTSVDENGKALIQINGLVDSQGNLVDLDSVNNSIEEYSKLYDLCQESMAKADISYNYIKVLNSFDKVVYSVIDNGISLDGLITDTDVSFLEIPSTVNNLPVVAIGSNSFKESSLNKVKIPTSVNYIGIDAFNSCSALTDVEFYDVNFEVEDELVLSDRCFENCSSLKNINLDSVTIIGEKTFLNCTLLNNINLNENLSSIGVSAFQNCITLDSIDIPSRIKFLENTFEGCSSLKNVALSDGLSSMNYVFKDCTSLESISIPKTCSSNDGVFYGCTSLKSVIFQGSRIYNIGENCFYGCSSLINVELPQSCYYIEESAFEGCSSLVSLDLNTIYAGIGSGAFNGCEKLEEISIDSYFSTFENIPDYLFSKCKSLKEIYIPQSVKKIGYRAFSGCSSLEKVVMLDNVEEIGASCFDVCFSLTDITLSSKLKGIPVGIFQGCTSLKEIILPDGIEYIEDYAFLNCFALESIVVPDSVVKLGYQPFKNCNSLKSISLPSQLKNLDLGNTPALVDVIYREN